MISGLRILLLFLPPLLVPEVWRSVWRRVQ